MLSDCCVGEDSWESLGLQGAQTSQSWRKSVLNSHWKNWCWSWSSSTLATWCEKLIHWKRPWCWEKLKAAEEGNGGWDSWMASPTQWTWVWVNSGRWWRTGKPGVLQFMRSQRVEHDSVTEEQLTSWILSLSRQYQGCSLLPDCSLSSTPLLLWLGFALCLEWPSFFLIQLSLSTLYSFLASPDTPLPKVIPKLNSALSPCMFLFPLYGT